jgi:hypothetical protein
LTQNNRREKSFLDPEQQARKIRKEVNIEDNEDKEGLKNFQEEEV